MALSFSSIKNDVRFEVKNLGLVKTAFDLFYRGINRILFFKILNCMVINTVNPSLPSLPSLPSHMDMDVKGDYKYGFLSGEQLVNFTRNAQYYLTEEFVQDALKNGDECYGILDGNDLASYGWYSNKSTGISFGASENGDKELHLHFSPQYIYMYMGYTLPSYRGQRLHAIGMNRSLDEYLKRGFKGLVSYVESNNFNSLKSVYRMGYRDFGKVYLLKVFGKYIIYHSAGCKDYSFRIGKH